MGAPPAQQAPQIQQNQLDQLTQQLAQANQQQLNQQPPQQPELERQILPLLYQHMQELDQQTQMMTPDYFRYNQSSILSFLVEVANQLRLDEPSRICEWSKLNLQQCLDATIKDLEAYIASVTS
jgi:hypothetical protein